MVIWTFLDMEIFCLKDTSTRHNKLKQNGPNFSYFIHVHSSAEISLTAPQTDLIIWEIHIHEMEDGVKSKSILWSIVGPSGNNFPNVSILLIIFMD